jgi:hypothetical protein
MTSRQPPSTNEDLRPRSPSVASAFGLSLVPCAGVAFALAFAGPGHDAPTQHRLAGLLLGLVALPAMLPIALARSRWFRLGVTALLTAVAVWSAVSATRSDDAQAGLALLAVLFLAVPAAVVVVVTQQVLGAWTRAQSTSTKASAQDRVAALLIDAVALTTILAWPVHSLSADKREGLAVCFAVAVSTAYQALSQSYWGRTPGQAAVRLTVTDRATGQRLTLPRAAARGALVSVEVIASVTLVGAVPAVCDLAAARRGRSLVDALVRSDVRTVAVRVRRSVSRPA